MSSIKRITALLAVQKGRVDRALALVHQRNGIVREKELERDAARGRWTDAVAAYQLEQQRLAESIDKASESRGIRATRLSNASLSCDAHRQWVAETAAALAVAEEALLSASAAAMEARVAYRRTLARQDALLTLQASLHKAQGQRALRLEEHEA